MTEEMKKKRDELAVKFCGFGTHVNSTDEKFYKAGFNAGHDALRESQIDKIVTIDFHEEMKDLYEAKLLLQRKEILESPEIVGLVDALDFYVEWYDQTMENNEKISFGSFGHVQRDVDIELRASLEAFKKLQESK